MKAKKSAFTVDVEDGINSYAGCFFCSVKENKQGCFPIDLSIDNKVTSTQNWALVAGIHEAF